MTQKYKNFHKKNIKELDWL